MTQFVGTLRTPRRPGAPSTPVRGEVYYNETDDTLYWWDGTVWEPVSVPVGGTTGQILMKQSNTDRHTFWSPLAKQVEADRNPEIVTVLPTTNLWNGRTVWWLPNLNAYAGAGQGDHYDRGWFIMVYNQADNAWYYTGGTEAMLGRTAQVTTNLTAGVWSAAAASPGPVMQFPVLSYGWWHLRFTLEMWVGDASSRTVNWGQGPGIRPVISQVGEAGVWLPLFGEGRMDSHNASPAHTGRLWLYTNSNAIASRSVYVYIHPMSVRV